MCIIFSLFGHLSGPATSQTVASVEDYIIQIGEKFKIAKKVLVINLTFLWFEKRLALFNFINRVLLPNGEKTHSMGDKFQEPLEWAVDSNY